MRGKSSSLGTNVSKARSSPRRDLAAYCQDDLSMLREACQILRREYLQIGNIDVFLESITIASACNKVLRKSADECWLHSRGVVGVSLRQGHSTSPLRTETTSHISKRSS